MKTNLYSSIAFLDTARFGVGFVVEVGSRVASSSAPYFSRDCNTMDRGRTCKKYGLVSTAEVIVRVCEIIRVLIRIKLNNYQFMNINSRLTRS